MARLEPLRHLVERARQLADLAGALLRQPQRRARRRRSGRRRRRPRAPDGRSSAPARSRRGRSAPSRLRPRHRRRARRCRCGGRRRRPPRAASVFSAPRKPIEQPPDLVGLDLDAAARRSGRSRRESGTPAGSGSAAGAKRTTYSRIWVSISCAFALLARVVLDEGVQLARAVPCSCRSCLSVGLERVRRFRSTVKLRKLDSTSETSFSSCSEAALTSFERASRSVASRCAETARISAVKAAPTSSASAALASHIRRASVMRATPRPRC